MSLESVLRRLSKNDPRHLRLLNVPSKAIAKPRRTVSAAIPLPCIYEGPVIEWCQTCKGEKAEYRHVRDCAIHEQCTRGANKGNMRSCHSCSDYDAYGEVRKRHLLYHLLPVAGNGVWQRSVEQLRMRWDLFTGRKIVAVVTGDVNGIPLETPETVREHLPPECEIVEVHNDGGLREVVSWIPLWESLLANADDADAVLYAHTKGATRNVDAGNSCQWWASLLYSLNLDHWSEVERLLKRHPIVGAFKKVGRGFGGSQSRWHYSGTFFWQRVGAIRGRDWKGIDRQWWGTESWPGLAYHPDEAACIFHAGVVPDLNCYSPQYWERVIRPEYSRWLQANRPTWPWLKASSPSGGS